MSATGTRPQGAADDVPTDVPDERETRRARLVWPVLVVVATAVFATVPAIIEPEFYVRGDSAAQFAPTWWHLGQLLREGQVPPVLDPGSFAGGNYAAETLFGIYNPVNWLIWLVVSGSADLRVSVTAVKVAVMAALALGTYLLSREYGARTWAAAAVAVALPFGGFTLFWDAGSWAAGLVAFAWTPWMWWAFRRTLHGRMNPFLAFVVGAMAVLQGNPYGTLAVALVGLGLVVEGLVQRRWRGTVVLAVVGACVAALLPLVYLPLVETVSLAVRSEGALIENNGRLRPTLTDVLLLGVPTYTPPIAAITGPMAVPATYFAWFAVPLLPWLRWSALRGRLASVAGLGVAGAVWLAMTLGPSKLWLFRWPIRLSEYVFLCLAVVLAVVLSRGLARDRALLRAVASAALVLAGGYLAVSEDPELVRRLGLGTLAVLLMTAVALAAARLVPRRAWVLALVLVLGTGATVALQVRVFGENQSSRVWHFPTDVAALQRDFDSWGQGRVIQVADLKPVQDSGTDRELRALWSDYLAGSMFRVAGVDAVNSYTGIGLASFTGYLDMNYDGLARARGYERLFEPTGPATGDATLADQLKVSTIVTQPQIARGRDVGEGWSRDGDTPGRAVVVRRDEPLPWPDSRLSYASDSVEVGRAASDGPRRDTVEVTVGDDPGTLVLATLGWPGYTATLDGEPVEVGRTRVGLLQVDLPAGASGDLEVTFTPPGQRLGLLLLGLATLVAAVLGLLTARSRRGGRRAGRTGARPGAPADDGERQDGPGSGTPPGSVSGAGASA